MKNLIIIFLLLCGSPIYSQITSLSGTWQGIKVNAGETKSKGKVIWFDFNIDENSKMVSGQARIETPFTDNYVLKILKGKLNTKNEIEFEDVMFGNKKNSGRSYWCLLKGVLIYNETTGYLTGKYSSSDCRGNAGEITLYRSKYKMSQKDTVSLYHSWFNNMCNDLDRGWNAYYVRDAEMKNFEFAPINFDHDKSELKFIYHDFLERMVKVVKSHSDLRIKIIGHTDSNGTDEYNVGLSHRRADTIKLYLLSLGIKADKIVIEFRGEKDPKISNSTLQGKKINRRVDFEFI